ncbi:MAG: hypothetical protein OEV01_03410 [Nitrospira sp.]|nr:hypothetical protein [Nitrospira sp.]MDH4304508.1 hypothetical protein [Nitrospira sp.]MDH5192690.1 hypothetical protein [Nitrospira sp.]
MFKNMTKRRGVRYGAAVVAMGVNIISVTGCSTDSPKPASTMTQEQVKSNADKSFERLKQEEKNRTTGSGPAPY